MNKTHTTQSLVISLILITLVGYLPGAQASVGISSLNLTDIEWIAPNVKQIALGLEPEFIFLPDGTMEIVYLDPEPYSQKLLYIDNSTGSWSDAVIVGEPQYGAENPGIAVDSNNVTHISYRQDAGGAYHVNNSNDVDIWETESMGGGQLISSVPAMAIGPDNAAHFIYYYSTSSYNGYTGGLTYINNTHFESHNTNNSITLWEQFPDIAVDSTGLVHIVYEGAWNNTDLGNIAVRDIFYQTFDPTLKEDQFSNPIPLSETATTGDYAQRPSILCDADDNIHVIFIQTESEMEGGLEVHRAYVKYLRIDSNPSSADLVNVNTIRTSSSYPSLAVDSTGNVHIVFMGYPQVEYTHYYESDVVYATNVTGTWTNERITNQPYHVGFPRIAINPLTDRPTILYLIKQAYTADAYMMEYVEQTGTTFGNHFLMSTALVGKSNEDGDTVSLVEEEAYSYILIAANSPIQLTMDLSNPDSETHGYDLEFALIENDYVSLVNGTLNQTLDSLDAEEIVTFSWYFDLSRGETSELEVQVLQDGDIIGKVIYIFNIGSPVGGIPFASVGMIVSVAGVSLGVLLYRRHKKITV
ncbi:MAG: hypothetical protein E4G98_06145 [Promethearchaeota archaeon]|nr:MAG: hypothetical protein E4G98_06145 [Candidatus Lokiarchaeota archaeon]